MTGKDLKDKIQNFDYKGAAAKAAAEGKELLEKLKGFPINYYLGTAGVLLLLTLILLGQNSGKNRKMREMQAALTAVQTQAQNDASAGAAKVTELEAKIDGLTAAAQTLEQEKAALTVSAEQKDGLLAQSEQKLAGLEAQGKAARQDAEAARKAAQADAAGIAETHQAEVLRLRETIAGLEAEAEAVAAEKAAVGDVTAKAEEEIGQAVRKTAELYRQVQELVDAKNAEKAAYESKLAQAGTELAEKDAFIGKKIRALRNIWELAGRVSGNTSLSEEFLASLFPAQTGGNTIGSGQWWVWDKNPALEQNGGVQGYWPFYGTADEQLKNILGDPSEAPTGGVQGYWPFYGTADEQLKNILGDPSEAPTGGVQGYWPFYGTADEQLKNILGDPSEAPTGGVKGYWPFYGTADEQLKNILGDPSEAPTGGVQGYWPFYGTADEQLKNILGDPSEAPTVDARVTIYKKDDHSKTMQMEDASAKGDITF